MSVPRLVRRTGQPNPKPLELRSEATYLVTGGLGSLGLEIAAAPDTGEDAAEESATEDAAPAKRSEPAKATPARETPAKPAPAKQAEAPAEGWKVQLGAYANERAARTAWATLVSQSATLLKGKTPVYAPRGGLVRLQVGPFDDRAPAADLCAKLSAAGRPCFVTK